MSEEYKAFKMDSNYIYIKCNYCWRIKNKVIGTPKTITGKKYKNMKNGFHIYNSYNNFNNRTIETMSNCIHSPYDFCTIIIDNKTLKIQ
jgi:hypothetical protein